MKYNIIDTHTHTYFPSFNKDESEVLSRAREAGVTHQIQIGCDEISSLAALNLAKKYKGTYATIGLHPCDIESIGIKNPEYHRYQGLDLDNYELKAKNLEELMQFFDNLYLENKNNIVGFGETGFDLYHKNTPQLLALQKKAFKAHLDLTNKYESTIVIHTRGAREETLEFLDQYNQSNKMPRGVIHCCCEDAEFMHQVTSKYNLFIGIGGVATYKQSEVIREGIRQTPLEFLVTETDAPFLVPNNFRKKGKKRNESAYLTEIIELVADIKELPIEECAQILFENGKRLYKI